MQKEFIDYSMTPIQIKRAKWMKEHGWKISTATSSVALAISIINLVRVLLLLQ